MSCLEIKRLSQGDRLCETCLLEAGPSRMGRFQVFLLGRPADWVCERHRKAWVELFESDEDREAA